MAIVTRFACVSALAVRQAKGPPMDKALAIAEILAYARRNRSPLSVLPPEAVLRDETEGYWVQDALHDLLAPDFGT
jgi:2-keto-4-pentenoate hydratase